jgi:SNF2 family DNA or RNA helicase
MPQVVSPLKPGGIPHLPALVVAPLQLVAQWISEIHNCLEPHGVVVLPYISMSIEAKNQFWSSTVPQAVKTVGGSLGNLIIVASTDVSCPLL